jgi:hypothetical protein
MLIFSKDVNGGVKKHRFVYEFVEDFINDFSFNHRIVVTL